MAPEPCPTCATVRALVQQAREVVARAPEILAAARERNPSLTVVDLAVVLVQETLDAIEQAVAPPPAPPAEAS